MTTTPSDTLYISYSDSHYDKRWQNTPKHLTARGAVPARGSRGTFECGIWGSIGDQPLADHVAKHGNRGICKNCLRVAANAGFDVGEPEPPRRSQPPKEPHKAGYPAGYPYQIPDLPTARANLLEHLAAANSAARWLQTSVESAELLMTSQAIHEAQQEMHKLSAALDAAKTAEAIYAGVKARVDKEVAS